MLNVTAVANEGFAIEPAVESNRLTVALTGTADMMAVDPLRGCLNQAHSEMTRLGLESVEIDIRGLYFLNSSCLNALVGYIYTLQETGPAYPLRFVTDPRLSWQKRALAALVRMAPEIVSVCEA